LRVRQEEFWRIEFTVDVAFVGIQEGKWLVEVIAVLENKGVVPTKLCKLTFDLRCLHGSDPIEDGPADINQQTNIPRVLIKSRSWFPKDWEWTFIHPGVRTRYSYVTAVPSDASFVLVHGRFKYPDDQLFHTADRLVQVPRGPLAS
jgi:hypothetical protein